MRRIAALILISLTAITVSSQIPRYKLTGEIEGPDGTSFRLQKISGGRAVVIQTAILKSGSLVMEFDALQRPEYVSLSTSDGKSMKGFFLENSNISIKGSINNFQNAEVTGSRTEDELNGLRKSIDPVYQEYMAKSKEYQAAKSGGNSAKASELEGLLKDYPAKMTAIQKKFILDNPKSYVIPLILPSLESSLTAGEIEKLIASVDPMIASTPEISDLKTRLEVLKKVDIGQKAPDFTMNDINGKPVKLSSLTGKNYLLIDFWAAWCAPCRAENPNVVRTYNEFRNNGFDIIGVSLDRTAADWKKGIEDDKLTWTHVSDLQYWNNSAARLYGVRSIPANFLLDRNGVIIARNLRGEELYIKIRELAGRQ